MVCIFVEQIWDITRQDKTFKLTKISSANVMITSTVDALHIKPTAKFISAILLKNSSNLSHCSSSCMILVVLHAFFLVTVNRGY